MTILVRKDNDNYSSPASKQAWAAMVEIERMSIALTRLRANITHSGYLLNTFGNVRRTLNFYSKFEVGGVTAAQLGVALEDRFGTDWGVEGQEIINMFTVTVPAIRAWFVLHQEDVMRVQDENSLNDLHTDTGRNLSAQHQAELIALLNTALADF